MATICLVICLATTICLATNICVLYVWLYVYYMFGYMCIICVYYYMCLLCGAVAYVSFA